MSRTAHRKFTAHYAPKPAGSPIPAPWHLDALDVRCTDTGRIVANVDDSAGVIRAERAARLIAAAPELADALESARAELAGTSETIDDARETLADALDGIRPVAKRLTAAVNALRLLLQGPNVPAAVLDALDGIDDAAADIELPDTADALDALALAVRDSDAQAGAAAAALSAAGIRTGP